MDSKAQASAVLLDASLTAVLTFAGRQHHKPFPISSHYKDPRSKITYYFTTYRLEHLNKSSRCNKITVKWKGEEEVIAWFVFSCILHISYNFWKIMCDEKKKLDNQNTFFAICFLSLY